MQAMASTLKAQHCLHVTVTVSGLETHSQIPDVQSQLLSAMSLGSSCSPHITNQAPFLINPLLPNSEFKLSTSFHAAECCDTRAPGHFPGHLSSYHHCPSPENSMFQVHCAYNTAGHQMWAAGGIQAFPYSHLYHQVQ